MHQAKHVLKNLVKAVAGLALGAAVALPAFAQSKGLDEPFREGYKKALAGKTVAFIPVAYGFDLLMRAVERRLVPWKGKM